MDNNSTTTKWNVILTIISVIAAVISGISAIVANIQAQYAASLLREQNQLIQRSISPQISLDPSSFIHVSDIVCSNPDGSFTARQTRIMFVRLANSGGATTSLFGASPTSSQSGEKPYRMFISVSPLTREEYFNLTTTTLGRTDTTFSHYPLTLAPGLTFEIPFEANYTFEFSEDVIDKINQDWEWGQGTPRGIVPNIVGFRFAFTGDVFQDIDLPIFFTALQFDTTSINSC